MECLTDIRDGHAAVINRTRGFSVYSQNAIRFSNIPVPLDVVNSLAFSPYTGGPITMDHENTVKAYSASPSMLGRGHSLVEPQGPVWVRLVSHGSPSIYTEIFAECTCLGFPSSAGRWRYRWDLLDNKFIEENETRRVGGMYSIAKFRNLPSDIAS